MTGGELHPTPRDIEGFVRSELSSREMLAVLAHLLRGCEVCQERIAPFADAMFRPGRPSDTALPWNEHEYDFPIFRAFATTRRQQEELARQSTEVKPGLDPTLLKEVPALDAASPESRRPSSWQRCEALLEQSRQLRHLDPEAMVMTAALAASLADRLDPRVFSAKKLADLQAKARAELGNARRVSGDLPGAESDLGQSLERSRLGSGDVTLLARILDFTASLYTDQRRFQEASDLLDRIYGIHRERGDFHSAGRALISKGLTAGHALDTEQAIRLLGQGLRWVDPGREPKLVLAAVHNLIWFLTDAGRLGEADRLLCDSRELYATWGERLDLLKVLWLEGRIAAGLGEDGRAEASYRQVRAGFVEAEMPYDAALVSLDLAGIWLQRGRTAEVPPLLDEVLTVLRARNIRREAIGALLMLKEAFQKDGATLGLVQAVESELQRCGREPARR